MCDWPRLSGELLRINLSAANLAQRVAIGPKAVCMPDRKKLSQLKASRVCCDGAAGSPRDRDSTTLTAGATLSPEVCGRERRGW